MELIVEVTMLSKPLYTDRTIISAAVPTAIPQALIAEMMLMTFCFFLAKRYRHAIFSPMPIIF